MGNEDWKKLVDHWVELYSKGKANEANNYYYDNLFKSIIERFIEKFSSQREDELLISLLGFSPEPIILTQKALKPADHYILATPNTGYSEILEKYLDEYSEIKLFQDNDLNIH